jgi:hypothetical protein
MFNIHYKDVEASRHNPWDKYLIKVSKIKFQSLKIRFKFVFHAEWH